MDETPYDDVNDSDEGYRSIWISTIIQALIDAVSVDKDPTIQKARREAIAWISQPERDSDFATVCELANIEPKVVKNLLEAVQNGRVKRTNFRWWKRGFDGAKRRKKKSS